MARYIFVKVLLLVSITGSSFLALWPMKEHLHRLQNWHNWKAAYSRSESALDIMGLSLLHSVLITALLATAASGRTLLATERIRARSKRLQFILAATSWIASLLLLAKAVVVALEASDDLWPHGKASVGLIYMFASIAWCLLMMVATQLAASAVLRSKQALEEEGIDDTEEPLLPKAGQTSADGASSAPPPERQATITALLMLAFPDFLILLVAFSAGVVAALGQAAIPYYIGRSIDFASIDPNPAEFKHGAVMLLAATTLCAVFTGIRGGLFTVAMARLNVRIRHRLFASLLRQEIGFFDSTKTGEITSRLSADTTTVADQVCLNLNVMLRSITQAALVLVFMFHAQWRLSVITFISVPVTLVVCKVYGSYYRKLSKNVQEVLAEANVVAEEVLSTMTTVKAFAAEDAAEASYADRLQKFAHLQLKEAAAYSVYAFTTILMPNSVAVVALFYGGTLVLQHRMNQGSLISFMLYQGSLSSAFDSLGYCFTGISAAVGAADQVVALMQRQPELSSSGTMAPAVVRGRLQLINVSFAYPSRPSVKVLSDLTLNIEPGQVVALVGPSGGGKSSIVKLVERFYLPAGGQVLLDGHDIGSFDNKWLRRRMAIVSQEPVLYARSIRDNILYGLEVENGVPEDEIPTEEDIIAAARAANALEFIQSMPLGFDTNCGDKGVQLSGGQKQRIAIARALVRRPLVLLLDEATSALDSESEEVVQNALDRVMQNYTVLVIAHRLSTVVNANKICVIKAGVVAEEGSHDQLLNMRGVYSSLVQRQMHRTGSVASIASMSASPSMVELNPVA